LNDWTAQPGEGVDVFLVPSDFQPEV
jgi:hypothetical protein